MKTSIFIIWFMVVYIVHVYASDEVPLDNPCEAVECPEGTHCRLQRGDCHRSKKRCPVVTVCVDKALKAINPVCKTNLPIIDSKNKELFCGRGKQRVRCPTKTKCIFHMRNKFAVCCYKKSRYIIS
ncbi:hypothetical protein SNE40_019288 [Patella caerulea]|uniref:Uncharacterized protein n=1 Tax=Patella caerulea TaxID=87958 RepID=A0AAN8P5N1_PATCE